MVFSYSVYIETYGCSANKNNTEIMKGILASHSINITGNEDLADIIIINTCIVKGPTIKKIEERIRFLTEKYKNKKFIITGCMPEVLEKRLEKLVPKASILGINHIKDISTVVKNLLEGKRAVLIGKNNEVKLCVPKSRQKKIIGITQIASGCLGNCAYCFTKKAKGNLFSFPEDKILKNIEQDISAGCKEIWLTSQDNACYGIDKQDFLDKDKKTSINKEKSSSDNEDIDLSKLINKITALNHRFFLRIGMMNPEHVLLILDKLIDAYKNEKVFKFLHVPIQSGSDKILKSMNRRYKVRDLMQIINSFKKEFPDITIATDIIVGFPGETISDFKETLNIIDLIHPDVLNISKFWPMPGTDASKMQDKINPKTKIERAAILMRQHSKIAFENKKSMIGKEYNVIVDEKGFQDTWLARNENYKLIIIHSKDNLLGKFVKVKIKEAKPHYLIGEII